MAEDTTPLESETTQDTTTDTQVEETKQEIQIPKSRFDQVNKERNEYKAKLAEFETKIAEEQGNWKQLAETREQELKDVQNKYKQSNLEKSLIQEAVKYNPHDLKAVMKFIETDNVTDETGEVNITGLTSELTRIKTEMPYLFKAETTSNAGNANGGNSSSSTGVIFKESQLQDSDFVSKNIKAIAEAKKEGRILIGQ
jgi:chromosome segregation ATPase